MSILDVFTILVKSNAKDTEKDFDSLDKKTKQTQESVDKTNKTTKDLGLTFSDIVKSIVTASGIDFSIKGLANTVAGVVGMEVGLGRLSKLTGVQANDISAWGAAIQRFSGGPAGEFENWLEGMNTFYQSMGRGDLVKQIIPGLIDLSNKWKDLDINAKQHMATIYQLTPDMVIALDQGGTALQGMINKQKELLSVTEQDTNAALELDQAWENLGRTLKGKVAEAIFHPGEFLEDMLFSHMGFSSEQNSALRKFLATREKGSADKNLSGSDATKILPLISQYESGNQNVINASGPGGTPASTASGYYQILNGTWRQFAPRTGVSLEQYPTAMSAPRDVQTKVASLLYNQQGITPWASDTRLMAALASGKINDADHSVLNGLPSSSNKTTNVSIGNITINTQATDAQGISNDLGNHLSTQLRNTVGSFDDSIVR